jgi:hypothetical protein
MLLRGLQFAGSVMPYPRDAEFVYLPPEGGAA